MTSATLVHMDAALRSGAVESDVDDAVEVVTLGALLERDNVLAYLGEKVEVLRLTGFESFANHLDALLDEIEAEHHWRKAD